MLLLVGRRLLSSIGIIPMTTARPSSDVAAFRKKLVEAKHVVVLTGAGISAESGVPTFRGAGGMWRTYDATALASPVAFARDPSLVWEFYHYRRELVLTKQPNAAHHALVECEQRFLADGKQFVTITQNVDDLHLQAGTKNLLRLHGSLFRVRCTKCGTETENTTSPICDSLRDRGAPDPQTPSAAIPVSDLPKCASCGGLLRPAVVWFGESLDPNVLSDAQNHCDNCDLCLVIGTSSVVYPAAMFAPSVAARGVPVAEFNIDETAQTHHFGFYFAGSAAVTVPEAMKQS